MKLIKKLLLLICALTIANGYGMKRKASEIGSTSKTSNKKIEYDSEVIVRFKTTDDQPVSVKLYYISKYSKTLYDMYIDADDSNEPIPVPFSSEPFTFIADAFQRVINSNLFENKLYEKIQELTIDQCINLANAACWADFQLLIEAIVEIITHRCLYSENLSPQEVLDEYQKRELNDALLLLIKNKLNPIEKPSFTITFKTDDDQLIEVNSIYFVGQADTLLQLFRQRGGQPVAIPFSMETFTFIIEALQHSYSTQSFDGEFCKKWELLTHNQLITIANAAHCYNIESLLQKIITIITHRCLTSDECLHPQLALQSYYENGLASELIPLIQNELNTIISSEENTIVLITNDHQEIAICPSQARSFKTIQNTIDSYENTNEPIFLPNISQNILMLLLQALKNITYQHINSSVVIEGLANQTVETLIALFNAADYLGSDYVCKALMATIEKKLDEPSFLDNYDSIAWLLQSNFDFFNETLQSGSFFYSLLQLVAKPQTNTPANIINHGTTIKGMKFSPDGQLLATLTDKTVTIYNSHDGSILDTLEGFSLEYPSLLFSPNGQFIVVHDKGPYGTRLIIKIYDVINKSCVYTLQCKSNVRNTVFSPDSQNLIIYYSHGTIELVNIINKSYDTVETNNKKFMCTAFSPDATIFAMTSDNFIQLWDIYEYRYLPISTGHKERVKHLAFSPDGKFLVTIFIGNDIKIWDVSDGSCLRTITHNNSYINHVVFSPDGEFFATCADNGTITLWTNNGDRVKTLLAHDQPVSFIAFSPYGQILVSQSAKTAKIWDINNGSGISEYHISEKAFINFLALSPDDQQLAINSSDGTTALYPLYDHDLATSFMALPFEQLLLLKLCYNAYRYTIPFNFSGHPYLKEVYDSCPDIVQTWINKLIPPQK